MRYRNEFHVSAQFLLVATLCDVYGATMYDELTLSIYPHVHL